MDDLKPILKERTSMGLMARSNWIFASSLDKLVLIIIVGLAVWKAIDLFKFIF